MARSDGMEYDAYVAKLYDTYIDTSFDTPLFVAEATEVGGEALELMAGTGRVSIPLVEAGVRLTCVDRSPEMLAVLREKLARKGLSACLHQMDVRKLNLGRQFELIYIPFNSFSELLTETDQLVALATIHDHLTSSGRFICTLHNPPVRLMHTDGMLRLRRRRDLGQGETLLVWGLESQESDSRLVRGIQFFEEYDAGNVMRRRTAFETAFCPLTRDEFADLAHAVGFRAQSLYGDYAYSPFQEDSSPCMVWVLGKGR